MDFPGLRALNEEPIKDYPDGSASDEESSDDSPFIFKKNIIKPNFQPSDSESTQNSLPENDKENRKQSSKKRTKAPAKKKRKKNPHPEASDDGEEVIAQNTGERELKSIRQYLQVVSKCEKSQTNSKSLDYLGHTLFQTPSEISIEEIIEKNPGITHSQAWVIKNQYTSSQLQDSMDYYKTPYVQLDLPPTPRDDLSIEEDPLIYEK